MVAPGLLAGRYEVRDVLGFGGMAEVRDGWDTRLNRAVAIKLLHPGLSSQPETRERFRVEACAAAALNHPNIVGVYDFGEGDGTPFIVMERLPGHTLGDQIAFGPLSQAHVHTALKSVLAALAAAHDAGMLHRDIKPSNLLLTDTGGIKVADFGIVKAPGSAHTTTGQLVGTLAYLSADRVAGKPASVTDDLYAVGVVGYEALTGRKPFTQVDIAPLARAIIEDLPPALPDLRPDLDPRLVNVIERAMSQDPLRRFDDAHAMAAALRDGVGSRAVPPPARPVTRVLPVPSPLPSPPDVADLSRPRRGRTFAGAAAVLGALAIAVLAFAMDSTSTTSPTTSEPVNVSASAPSPTSPTAAPTPVVQPIPPAPSMTAETVATQDETPGNGNGNGGNGSGHGNGHGNKKQKG